MTWGLALSGGAAYGLANAGIIDVLHREGLRPGCISGSSMGAIVGGLYALKGDPAPLRMLCEHITLWNVTRMSDQPLKGGRLHSGIFRQRLAEHLMPIVDDARIGDCRIPFVCVAAKINTPIEWSHILLPGFTDEVLQRAELHVFPKETRLLDAFLATSAIPVLFSPVTIGNETFVDLVHFGAVPARTLRKEYRPAVVIGTNTTPVYETLSQYLPSGWNEFLERGYAELEQSLASCDLVITPTLTAAPFRFDKATAFVQEGKEATRKMLPEIRKVLNKQMKDTKRRM